MQQQGNLASLTLNPPTVAGGLTSTGTVTLNSPAPAGGAAVTLSSSNTAVATVPESITIAAGTNSGSFTVNTNVIASDTTVNISATYNAVTRTAALTVLAPPPDLQVPSIIAPAQTSTDSAFDLTWTDANSGQGRANGPWTDRVLLSADAQLGNDMQLAEFPFSQSLDPGQSAARTQVIIIPRSAIPADGQYFLIVQADAGNSVAEGGNESNNWRAVPITISRPPLSDLTVETIEAPTTAFFEQTITVRWTVKNVGNGSTDASGWNDQVFLSRDRTLDEVAFQTSVSNVSYLNAGESYVASADVRIPRGLFQTHYIIVKTDGGNAVLEGDENNNTRDKAIDIQIPSLPDLQVALVQAPEEGFTGQPMQLNWRVENRGTGSTPPEQNTWFDAIYLSRDTTLDPADRLIGGRNREGGLTQNEGYTVSGFSVDIPRNVAGDWYVFVVTDHRDSVYEFLGENNNANHDASPIQINATPPDLIVTAFTAPETGTAARQLTVNWTVRNQGAFEAGPSWFDTVYLSSDPTLEPIDDRALATVSRASSLGPGLSYDASTTVSLAACTSGTHYLYVATDSRDQVFEFDPAEDAEENNSGQPEAVQITAAPPDLQVTSVVNATTGNAGQPFSVSWTVTNGGVGPTVEGTWTDNVYLSPTQTFSANTALLAGSVTHGGDLAPNGSYTSVENVNVPQTAHGTYYVFVLTDGSNTVEECAGENNNVGGSQLTLNVTNNVPDLRVTGINAPADAFAGQTVTVQWTGDNAGTLATQNPAWNDAVYFSADPTLNTGDERLAATLVNGPVSVGGTYAAQAQVRLPLAPAGTYYLIVKADGDNFVFEGQGEGNNAASRAIQINTPNVDLLVAAVNAPVANFSGQLMPVSWTVTNAGAMQTLASQWTDYVVLSRDQILDTTDAVIGHNVRNGALDAGGSYGATLDARVPAGLSGPYYVFVRTDRNNQVAEANEANNAGVPVGVVLNLPPPSNLMVTAVEVPASGSPGEPATINWTVANQGQNAATGQWRDAVYLSRDRTWDIGDALVGRVDHSGPLPTGQTYRGTITETLPAVDPGGYYVIVRADVRNSVREDDETNNTTASAGTMAVDVTQLQLGVPFNTTLRTGQERFHKVNAPAGETLLYTLDAQRDDSATELFARHGAMPSRSAFDYLFSRPNEADQEIVIPNTLAGLYYDLMRGVYVPPDAGDMPATIKAEIIPFSIRSVSPNRIGDNGQVTITLKGARFQDGATVKMVGNGTTLPAAKVMVLDSATIKARFNFTNAPHGIYDAVLTNPNDMSVTAPQSLTIETATQMLVELNASGNLSPRVGRTFIADTALINRGNVDAPYVSVSTRFTGNVTIVARRPAQTLPRKSDSPDVDWENTPPTNIYDGDATEDTFFVRDLEAGQILPFTIHVRGFTAGPFRIRMAAVPQTRDQFMLFYREVAERQRQTIIANGVQLPSEVELAITSPDSWWNLYRSILVQLGFIDQSDNVQLTMSAKSSLSAEDSLTCEQQALVSFRSCKANIFATAEINLLLMGANLFRGGTVGSLVVTGTWYALCWEFYLIDLALCHEISPPPIPCDNRTWSVGISVGGSGSTAQGCGAVGNPSDPNDKTGLSGFGPQAFVATRYPLPYTINFENVPTATAAAQRIRIDDQLDPNLDWRTFRLKEIGFGNYRITVPENRAFFQTRIQLGADLGNLLADISAGVNIATGHVTWTLTAIDPQTGEQPNAAALGLLPPNDQTGRGQGYVTYTIQPKIPAPTGTQIANNATIIFDTEEPIITNTVTNTLDADPPSSTVTPLPPTSPPVFTLSWSGDDAAGGAGIQSYDIWVSENNGPYQPFISGTTETSAQFTGQPGRAYRFYSVARDNAGNVEAAPAAPDAATAVQGVPPNPTPTLTGLSPNSAVVGGPAFTLTVNGTDFVNGSVVRWNGSNRTTTFISDSRLWAAIPASDIAAPGTAVVTVVNPAPGGGTSNALAFTVSTTPPPPPSQTVQFDSATYTVAEVAGSATVRVTRSGNTSVIAAVNYATANGTASDASDYTAAAGTLRFAVGEASKTFAVLITDDAFAEGGETVTLTLSSPAGAGLGATSTATLTISDNDTTPPQTNPIDAAEFFVRQHYHDFLNREPDPSGFAFWVHNITGCGTHTRCVEVKRIDTSAAFFLSIEFQDTGNLVHRLYKAAYGNIPGKPVPVGLQEFLADTQQIGQGIVVGAPGWEQQLEANKQAFAGGFVTRARFADLYPAGMTPEQFVDALNTNSGGVLSQAERDALVGDLRNNVRTRAQALRAVAEDEDMRRREFNSAFVLMQYFGYLRRNPDDPPDNNFVGYDFWLTKLNNHGGDYRRAEMVKAFILAGEYRGRFGMP